MSLGKYKGPESVIKEEREKNELGKRKKSILRYIKERVVGANGGLSEAEEREVEQYYQDMSPLEKANSLYSKLMAYTFDRQAEIPRKQEAEREGKSFEPETADPYLISEIKVLLNDEETKEVFADKYSEARLDAKNFRSSELGNLWGNITQEMSTKEKLYGELERDLHLGKVQGRGKTSSVKSRMALLSESLDSLKKRKTAIERIDGLPKTAENTDVAAILQYKTFVEYKKQLQKGFVWLPSRKSIHQETVSAILNHRWPVLIGEAGSGKSEQADAAALELTGYPPTEVACEVTTAERDLIKDTAIAETGESYMKYGPLMEAFTGYENEMQKAPTTASGRIVRFDESGRLGPKGYSIIKKARQVKSGDSFYGRPVLPGACAIWTSNPVGPRYPDRHAPDPAMRRELAEIFVPYPEMSAENPELYEFMVTALMDENDHIAATREELSPAYEKKDLPEAERKHLEDGSTIVAKDELISNMADRRHGALWRFAGAIKSLQDSFVYGNGETERYPETILRFKEDADGKIKITTDGSGEPLTLSISTVTLGEVASWMAGFNERMQKQDKKFHTNGLTEWLNFKITTYLKQADKADKKKLEALFRHFGFLESNAPNLGQSRPLSPKEIGYLSPRVPRPVYVEKPKKAEAEKEEKSARELKGYETTEVLLDSDERVSIRKGEFAGKTLLSDAFKVAPGKLFMVQDSVFSFAGVTEDGKLVASLADEKELHKIFTENEVEIGILNHDLLKLGSDLESHCEIEAKAGKK